MSEYEELDDRLRTWLAEDEMWAREASRFSAENSPERGWVVPEQIPGGMHWRWAYGENWDAFTPDVSISPILNEVPEPDEWHHVTLTSVETWEWRLESGGVSLMPERIIGDSDRVPTAAAGHIQRHDPAAVLADIAGKRALLDALAENVKCHDSDDRGYAAAMDAWELALTHLAAGYVGRPEFKAEWRIDQ